MDPDSLVPGRTPASYSLGRESTDCYANVILLRITLYPYVVGHQRFRSCLNSARRCYFSPAALHELCRFSFQHVGIARFLFLCLQIFKNLLVPSSKGSITDCIWDSPNVRHHFHGFYEHCLPSHLVSGIQMRTLRSLENVDGRGSQDQGY